MNRVDRHLCRYRRRAFQGFIYTMSRHDLTTARRCAVNHRDPERRKISFASIALAEKNWEEAARWIGQIANSKVKHYLLALRSLDQRDWEGFYAARAKVTDEHTLLIFSTRRRSPVAT